MKYKIILAGIIASMFVATGAAQTLDIDVEDRNLTKYEETVNQHTDDLPGWIKNLIGDQDINVHIDEGEDDAFNLSIRMDGLKVENLTESSLENPNIEVWTSTEIIQNITESESPVDDVEEAINEGDIEYEANDAWTKVKLFFADLFMGLL